MTKTTLFDLAKSASAAAEAAAGKDILTADQIKMDAFKASGFDTRDYARWCAMFSDQLTSISFLSQQLAPSAAADAAAAQAAAIKAASASPEKN